MLHPPEVNLHDWAEVYFNETGWIPADQSFKLKPSDDPLVRYYYLGNTDNYHFIVNDDISGNFYPAKIHPRSETVDFQRGEVEWRGRNLYFNKWNYENYLDYKNERGKFLEAFLTKLVNWRFAETQYAAAKSGGAGAYTFPT